MTAVRHFKDEDSYYNGSEGQWTICGLDWWKVPHPSGNVEDCTECVRLRQERIDKAMAEWR